MIKMVVSDLDGTLLDDNGEFSDQNLYALHRLKSKGIVPVIATGRSPFSASMVLPDDFPIDFLVFSSGAGIIKWADKSIIYSRELEALQVQSVIDVFVKNNVDFMVHEPIPQNHCFHYHRTGIINFDFEHRLNLYHEHCSPLILGIPYPDSATQIIAILPSNLDMFHKLSLHLKGIKIIRATSPLDGKSIWMEIFPDGVSKAYGVDWLCKSLEHVLPSEIVAIGNDYNDVDLLNYADHSCVVDNAPDELKQLYDIVPANNKSGFAYAVRDLI